MLALIAAVADSAISLGDAVNALPAPEVDLPAFMAGLDQISAAAGQVWDPVTGTFKHWIDIAAFQRCYAPAHVAAAVGRGGHAAACCVIM